MKLEIEVYEKKDAGNCDVMGCHNKAEFGVHTNASKIYICNYHVGPCIKRMAKKG
jgi:hypothetical protein